MSFTAHTDVSLDSMHTVTQLHQAILSNMSGVCVCTVQEELTEVTAVCEVEEMEKPLVLSFCSKAKGLSVSYSLPHTNWYSLKHTHSV